MAYKINRSDENVILPDGPATVRDVQRYVIQKGTPEFYELEAAEVIEVYVDEEDLPLDKDNNPDWSKYGWISARMSVSNSGIDDIIDIKKQDKLSLSFRDKKNEEFDYLIAADGVYSKTKQILFKKEGLPKYYNSIALRGNIQSFGNFDISLYAI